MKTIFCLAGPLLFSSCATLGNMKSQPMKIAANEPAIVIMDEDTLNNSRPSRINYTIVERQNKPLFIEAIGDSSSKSIVVHPHFSASLLNFASPAHAGFLVDLFTPKRFAYPKEIYIDFEKRGNTYLNYLPIEYSFSPNQHLFKTTPLKWIGIINPAIEVAYERPTSNRFSTQIMASYLLPISLWDMGVNFHPQRKGFKVALEQRYYLRQTAPNGFYLAVEMDYMYNRYRDRASFGEEFVYSDSLAVDGSYSEKYKIFKQTASLNFKVGFQKIFSNFIIDVYFGLGARYRDVRHSGRTNPGDEYTPTKDTNLKEIINEERTNTTINIPLNFRIGWRF